MKDTKDNKQQRLGVGPVRRPSSLTVCCEDYRGKGEGTRRVSKIPMLQGGTAAKECIQANACIVWK